MWLLVIVSFFQFSSVLAATPVELGLLFKDLRAFKITEGPTNKNVRTNCEGKNKPCHWKDNEDIEIFLNEPSED